MTVFYCVRHGKTIFNQQGIFQGGTVDSPLTEEGVIGAKNLGEQLRTIRFDDVKVSPLKRAQDTCKLILAANNQMIEPKVIPELREMEFGLWDGKPEADYQHLEEFQQLVNEPHLYRAVACGGETFADVLNSSQHFFKQATQEYPKGTILVVSHGLLLQTFIKSMQGIQLKEIRKGTPLKNTSVSIIESDAIGENFVVKKWNCTNINNG